MPGRRKRIKFLIGTACAMLVAAAALFLIRGHLADRWPVLFGIVIAFIIFWLSLPKPAGYESRPYMRLSDFDSMDSDRFRDRVADLLQRNGYRNVEQIPFAKIEFDITAERDGIRYGFLCACNTGMIDSDAVRYAFLRRAGDKRDRTVVITNGKFTMDAADAAADEGVELWGRDRLQDLINGVPRPDHRKIRKSEEKK